MIARNGQAVLERARDYVAAGLSPLPIRTDGSKAPAISEWQHLQRRIATADELGAMFRGYVGIGIAGGPVSGDLEILDVDNFELFAPFEAEAEALAPGLLGRLPQIKTPKGMHIYYRCDNIAGNQKLAQHPEWNEALQRHAPKTAFEVRGDGGYVVAPGSPIECHELRLPYQHVAGPDITDVPRITPQERAILFQVARSFNKWVDPTATKTEPRAADSDRNGNRPGDMFNEQATWEEVLEPHGWKKLRSRGDVTYWQRPGKEGVGWSATTGLKSQAGADLLCVFSQNAYPFEGATLGRQCTSYSKFAAFALLNHGGDYGEATKDLAARGYGDPPQHPAQADDDQSREQRRHLRELAAELLSDIDSGKPTKLLLSKLPERVDAVLIPDRAASVCYKRITAKQMAAAHYETHWHVKGVLVRGQPCGMFAPKKCLKTSIAADLSWSVATGGHFLGRFPVEEAVPVAFMSGESGLSTLKETFERIAVAAGRRLEDATNLIISPDLPQLGSAPHLKALEQFLADDAIELLVIDPLYLCADTEGREGSLFAMGKMLRSVAEICQARGTTLLVLHHMKKSVADPFTPGELDDASWAGMAEWVRQWALLNRRTRYEGGSGVHKLWLSLGGSAGHSSTWGLDVYEGVYDPDGNTPRVWEVELMSACDVHQAATDERQNKKQEELDRQVEAHATKIIQVCARLPNHRGTKTDIKDRSALNTKLFDLALAAALNSGKLRISEEMITKANKQKYTCYEVCD